MNRNEAIEKSAQLFLQVLEHNDNRLTDAVYESINNLREALAMPKTDAFSRWENEEIQEALPKDAEPVAWQRRISQDGVKWLKWDDYSETEYDQTRPPKVGRWFAEYRPLYTHPPQADAERVALIRQLDEHLAHGEIVGIFDTLLSIRAYLQGGA